MKIKNGQSITVTSLQFSHPLPPLTLLTSLQVLEHTRNGGVRARILGLRTVKHLVEKLKEEYGVVLPNTIPVLSELLEDVELPVKTLAQEILKDIESLTDESLEDYL